MAEWPAEWMKSLEGTGDVGRAEWGKGGGKEGKRGGMGAKGKVRGNGTRWDGRTERGVGRWRKEDRSMKWKGGGRWLDRDRGSGRKNYLLVVHPVVSFS